MTCQHQFIKIQQLNRRPPEMVGNSSMIIDQYGVQTGCALCGEVRTVWENGEVEINHKANASDTKN